MQRKDRVSQAKRIIERAILWSSGKVAQLLDALENFCNAREARIRSQDDQDKHEPSDPLHVVLFHQGEIGESFQEAADLRGEQLGMLSDDHLKVIRAKVPSEPKDPEMPSIQDAYEMLTRKGIPPPVIDVAFLLEILSGKGIGSIATNRRGKSMGLGQLSLEILHRIVRCQPFKLLFMEGLTSVVSRFVRLEAGRDFATDAQYQQGCSYPAEKWEEASHCCCNNFQQTRGCLFSQKISAVSPDMVRT